MELVRLYSKKNVEVWGRFMNYKDTFGNTNLYVTDIHITDTNEKVVLYKYFGRLLYNTPDMINIVDNIADVVDTVLYMINNNDNSLTHSYKFKSTLDSFFKDGRLLQIKNYSAMQLDIERKARLKNKSNQIDEIAEVTALEMIKYLKDNNYIMIKIIDTLDIIVVESKKHTNFNLNNNQIEIKNKDLKNFKKVLDKQYNILYSSI